MALPGPPNPHRGRRGESLFDLSFRGGLPDLLRALAARIESREASAEEFQWRVTEEKLWFSGTLDMKGEA